MPKPFEPNDFPTADDLNDIPIYDRSPSLVDVFSTTAATNLYSKLIAAGHMSTDRLLRLTMLGDFLNNTGTGEAANIDVDFNSVTIWRGALGGESDADRRAWFMQLWLASAGATNSQQFGGILGISDAIPGAFGQGGSLSAFGTSGAAAAANQTRTWPIGGFTTQDTTGALIFSVVATPTVNSDSLSIRKKYALLELL